MQGNLAVSNMRPSASTGRPANDLNLQLDPARLSQPVRDDPHVTISLRIYTGRQERKEAAQINDGERILVMVLGLLFSLELEMRIPISFTADYFEEHETDTHPGWN